MNPKYEIQRPPLPRGVKLDENVYVTMRDGIRIAVDVFRPEAPGRYPCLFSASPYFKEIQHWPGILSHSIEAGATHFFVPKGYVHLIVQARGSGLSQGRFNWYDSTEQQDGYELVEWAARQPWCDGNVAMIGDSYFGRIQYLIAALKPPHLKCIVPFDAGTDDYRDARNQGGLLNTQWLGMWGIDLMRQCMWPGPIEGKQQPANLFIDRILNPDDGPYYWERSGCTKLDDIEVPVLNLVMGHSPTHSRGQLWAHPRIKSPKKLVVVPAASPLANVFFLQSRSLNELILKWLDYWLKGINTGIMDEPPVAIHDNATRQWRYESEYPLARTKWTKFYLRSDPAGATASEPPYGLISTQLPGSENPDSFTTPDSLEKIYARKPVLAYSTAPLDGDLRIWGPLSAVLFASTTARDTAWFVKLGDIDPDGKMSLLSNGVLKASYRQIDAGRSGPGQPFGTFRNPTPPEPEKVYEYQIEMIPLFHTFRKGHRIWFQIASDDFDYQDRLHTIYTVEMLPVPAVNSIYHDSAHASCLYLPVVPDAPAIRPVEPPISEMKWPLGQNDW